MIKNSQILMFVLFCVTSAVAQKTKKTIEKPGDVPVAKVEKVVAPAPVAKKYFGNLYEVESSGVGINAGIKYLDSSK